MHKEFIFEDEDYHAFPIIKRLVRRRTRFQEVLIAELGGGLGKCVLLDGKMQGAEHQQEIYHEALVWPALVAHGILRGPGERALVIGGGEGATAWQLLRSRTIKHVDMVDIDQEFVEICKVHLPEWHRGAFDDPRLRLTFADGRAFLEEAGGQTWDVVIVDLSDPTEEEPAGRLYTKEFYEVINSRLSERGVVAIQALGMRYLRADEIHGVLVRTIRGVFPDASPGYVFLSSFDVLWCVVVATKPLGFSNGGSLDSLNPQAVDEQIALLLGDDKARELIFYDGMAHTQMFTLNKLQRAVLSMEGDISTDAHLLSRRYFPSGGANTT